MSSKKERKSINLVGGGSKSNTKVKKVSRKKRPAKVITKKSRARGRR